MHELERAEPAPDLLAQPACHRERIAAYGDAMVGGGPRICIGNAFAMMEAVLVLVTIARRFAVSPVDDRPLALVPTVTLRPKDGVTLRLARRDA